VEDHQGGGGEDPPQSEPGAAVAGIEAYVTIGARAALEHFEQALAVERAEAVHDAQKEGLPFGPARGEVNKYMTDSGPRRIEKLSLVIEMPSGPAEFRVRDTNEKVIAHRVPVTDVVKKGDSFVHAGDESIKLESRAYKMSKSRGNVVNPDTVVKEYGADALRLYEMFMGPLEATKPWSMTGVNGVRGFLDRVWRLIVSERSEAIELNPTVQKVSPTDEQNRILHKTIAAVTADIDHLDFNTAIARMMEFTNFFTKETGRPQEAMEKLVLLLSPLAPHLAEELWQILGHEKTLAYEPWPRVDERWLKEDTVEIPVQINGKLRGKITVPAGSDQTTLESAARADSKIAELLAGKTVAKCIVVPRRLVNFVVR
jgi:leucyl-tRNA synthetase